MRPIKVLGLMTMAAVAAMAFLGTGMASALPDEIALCEALPSTPNTLCPIGKVLPAGTEILWLASHPTLSGTVTIECEDSIAITKTTASMGATLGFELTKLEFGKLPTPSLGSGCTGCTGGIHTKPPYSGTFIMSNSSDYVATMSVSERQLNCPFGIECEFGSGKIEALLDADATQHDIGSQVKGDLLLIESKVERTGGSALCGSTVVWKASYTSIGCHEPGMGTEIDCWVALREHL
jgi:hypothetical protein